MIETQQVHDRGMKIVNVNGVLHDLRTDFVCRTVNIAGFDSTASQPASR